MRAADQIRMAAVSFANLKLAGSHVGVSIGEDGPSQMALEVRFLEVVIFKKKKTNKSWPLEICYVMYSKNLNFSYEYYIQLFVKCRAQRLNS